MLEILSLVQDIPDFKYRISKLNPQPKKRFHFNQFKDLCVHLFKKGNDETDCNHPIIVVLKPDEDEEQEEGREQRQNSQGKSAAFASSLEKLAFREKCILLDYFFGHHCLFVICDVSSHLRSQRDSDAIASTVHNRISRIGAWTETVEATLNTASKTTSRIDRDLEEEILQWRGERVPTMTQLLHKNVTRTNKSSKLLIHIKHLLTQEIDFVKLLSNQSPQHFAHLSAIIGDWSFPAHELNNDDLIFCAFAMLKFVLKQIELDFAKTKTGQERRFQFADKLTIPTDNELFLLIFLVRESYRNGNPFHNFRHAVDVLQACFYFCLKLGDFKDDDDAIGEFEVDLKEILRELPRPTGNHCRINPIQSLALLVSALGHDVAHPGITNNFLIQHKAPISLIYNDRSVLESYHASIFINKILVLYWPSLLATKISSASKLTIQDIISVAIIATDMSNHFDYLHELKTWSQEGGQNSDGSCSDSKLKLMAALLIKSADISNVARPLKISSQWAVVLQREFDEVSQLEALIRSLNDSEETSGSTNNNNNNNYNEKSKNKNNNNKTANSEDLTDDSDSSSIIGYFEKEEIVYETMPTEIDKIVLRYPLIPKGQLFFIGTFAENLFNNISKLYPPLDFACEIIKENKKYWQGREKEHTKVKSNQSNSTQSS
ncbi:uncharacterized protein LODBEIA_P28980 [Lodderomyces beijingensis]|uniref:Phosphodiesterase n=1 Tax=Lodderomyces beijingensis TaxID=1775926 RepID=A0ABP0ZLC4_9ASCO